MSVVVRVRNGMAPSGGSGGVTEGDLRGDHGDIIDSVSGVVDLAGGHCLVHQAGTPAMTVVVDSGVAYIPNTSFDEIDSDSIKFWEAVIAGATISRTLSIGANSSGQTRIDIVCVKLSPGDTPDENASDVAELIIVAGEPGDGVPATPSYHVKLAEVTVVNGATEILNASIEDVREQIAIKDAVLPTTMVDKSLDNPTIIDPSDATKQIGFDLSGATTGKKVTVKASPTGNRTITLPNATTTLIGKDTTDTLTNKRNTKRVYSEASNATPTPDMDSYDQHNITALAAAAAFAAPTGTPTDGQVLAIRIKDDGTARALTWDAVYRAVGAALPSTTVIGKTLYVAGLWNAAASKLDVLLAQQEA